MGKRFLCALLTASLMMSGIPAQALSAHAQGLDTETESALYEMEVGESSAVDETERNVSDGSVEVSTESREEQSSTTGENVSSEIEHESESVTGSESLPQETEEVSEDEESLTETEESETKVEDEASLNAGEKSGQCGDNLTWSLSDDGVLTISGTGAMWDYPDGGGIDQITTVPWGKYADELRQLIIEDGITYIDSYAFYNCNGFTGDLIIPNSVTEIGKWAFWKCNGFTGNLIISNRVTTIGEHAFSGCSGFTGNLTIPNSVTTIGEYAFSGCNGFTGSLTISNRVTLIEKFVFSGCGFTGDLTIPNSVKSIKSNAFSYCHGFNGNLILSNMLASIEDMAFYDCSGFAGSLAIPNSVTTIGGGAFSGCKGFTGTLTFPSGISTIGGCAFQGCSGLTGNLVLPDNVTIIGGGTFEDCSGFTGSLIIPDNVTTIELNAFYNCTGLTDVYLPSAITSIGDNAFHKGNSIPLSVTMHCPVGSYAYQWAVDHGFRVEAYEPEPDEPVIIKPVPVMGDKAVIQVYSMSTKEPIKDAEVTIGAYTYNTDSNGEVSVSASDSWNKITVKVDADDYLSALRGVKVKKGQVSRIGLTKKEDGIQITSVMAYQDNDIYDLLGEKLVLGYRKDLDDILENKQVKTVSIHVEASDTIRKCELINESGDVLLESTKDKLEFDVVTSGEKGGTEFSSNVLLTSQFKPGEKYYIKVTDTNLNSTKKAVGISPTINYWLSEKKERKSSVKIGEKTKITVPPNIPLVGGGELEFGFADELPLEMTIDDNTIKIAINKPADKTMEKFSKEYKNMENFAKNMSKNDFFKDLGHETKFGAGFFSPSGKICGYGEGKFSETLENKITVKVGLLVEVEGKGGYKWYMFVGSIPVHIKVEGSVNGSADLKAQWTFKNEKLEDCFFSDSNFKISVGVGVTGGVGIGIEINASGNGKLNYVWKPAREYQKAWLDASAKVTMVVFCFKKDIWNSKNYKYTLFEKGEDVKPFSLQTMSDGNENQFSALSRNYLDYSQGYCDDESKTFMAANASGSSVVKAAVYPAASPKLIECGGTYYLFWLEDIPSREDNNRTALVYATSKNGNSWSEPKRVLSESEDGTLDGAYAVAAMGDQLLITWQDAVRKIGAEDDVTSVAKSLSVRTVMLDTSSGAVSKNRLLTTQAGYYMYPCTVAAGGEAYYAYVENELSSGDLLGNGKHHLYVAKGDEQVKEAALPEKGQIVNMTAGCFGGEPYAVCEIDTDGDIATEEDREIYTFSMKDGSAVNISNNNVCDTMPCVSERGIYWYQAGNIMHTSSPVRVASPIWSEPKLQGKVWMTAVTNSNGNDVLMWESVSPDTEDGSVTVWQTCENSDGSWQNPVRFAETRSTVPTAVSAITAGDEMLAAHLEGGFLEDGSLLKDLCVIGRENLCDLAIESVEYDEESVRSGSSLPLTAVIKNNGNCVIDRAEFAVNDSVIETLENLGLQPYESREIAINGFSVPDDLASPTTFTLKGTVSDDICDSNDSASLVLGCPDLHVEATSRLENESTWLDFTVNNSSSYHSSGVVRVHKDGEKGEVIFEERFDSIGKDEGYAYTMDLKNYESESTQFYVETVADCEENLLGDNTYFAYIGYGTGVEGAEASEEADTVTSISLNNNELALRMGETSTLAVYDNAGNVIDAANLMWTSSDKTVAGVDDNGVVTAYRNGSTVISAYYGELSASCEVIVNENRQRLLTLQFDTQGGGEVDTITGIVPGSEVALPAAPVREGYIFDGWYTMAEGGDRILDDTVIVEHSMTLYAHWSVPESKEGLWISEIADQMYTGKAIKPEIKVYDGAILLKEKVDYTVSYKNNIQANDASVESKAPQIIVKGKGNYSGTEKAVFKILPVDIASEDVVTSEEIILSYNKRIQKKVPSISFKGRKLKNKTDFTVEYVDNSAGAYQNIGSYKMTVTGNGNFTGIRQITVTITDKPLLSSASVERIPKQTYTGSEITPKLTVRVKNKVLTEGTDYIIAYQDNIEVGKAVAILTGIGDYAGTKTIQFQIIGTPINKASVTGIENKIYDGGSILQNAKVILNQKTLEEGIDYRVTYAANKNAGKATMIIQGINAYSGQIKKSFKILPYDLATDRNSLIQGIDENISIAYRKGGCMPEPVLTFGNQALEKDTDYAITYQNNRRIGNSTDQKSPLMIIRGRGNFKGTVKIPFTITQRSFEDKQEPVQITVAEVGYVDKSGNYISKPVLTDIDGKVLKAGVDYEKEIMYALEDGKLLSRSDKVQAGSVIYVEVTGKGAYTGTLKTSYRIAKTSFSKAKITIKQQAYTGKEIVPGQNDITVKIGSETLEYGKDYEIVPESLRNNVKKGTASVTIKGKGNYGGSKTVKFKIVSKKLSWFWRLFGR